MNAHLSVDHLKVHYPVRRGVFRRTVGWVRAVDDVSLTIPAGAAFGLVGESGCGKSSLGRAVLRLQEPTAGRILFRAEGQAEPLTDIAALPPAALKRLRREMQIVFQDPYSALNPRLTVGRIIDEPFRAMTSFGKAERRARIAAMLEAVGLAAGTADRYPHQFSGGQRQRIAIARALISEPNFLVLDEPVSALDVSVRAQILNLLLSLQRERRLTYLFVSHDLSVVRYLCDRIAVMYLGRIVESGPTESVFASPLHPYTKLLLAAAPAPAPRRRRRGGLLPGDPPSPMAIPAGCRFQTRCPAATALCRRSEPELLALAPGHGVACHHATPP